MTKTPAYREQHERLTRWHSRFAALDQGRVHDVSSDHYLDDIYAFFLNCYHLKDWIRQDMTVPASVRQQVEPFIDSNRALRLCADICNALKHLRLTRPRSGESPSFGTKRFEVALGPGQETTISLKYQVDTTGGPIDAFALATECVQAWTTFMTTNALA